jgi:hypothetical protein
VDKRGSSPGKEKAKSRQARSRSNSANRKIDLRARYWSYLFDNLKRAVDEIYTTCETDESVMECQVMYKLHTMIFKGCLDIRGFIEHCLFVSLIQEVIMMLDQCRNDFQSLIDRIQLHAAFERADSKDRLDFRLLFYCHSSLQSTQLYIHLKIINAFIIRDEIVN